MVNMRTPSSDSPRRALRIRDAGLRKISVTTRVLVVGSVAAAGAFASMAAWAQPGRTVIRTATPNIRHRLKPGGSIATVPATTPATTPQNSGSDDDGGGDDLTPPATTPVTAPAPSQTQDPGYQNSAPSYQYAPAPVVSGAS
jgi:hypothetical protein